jgi:hypothetical protein
LLPALAGRPPSACQRDLILSCLPAVAEVLPLLSGVERLHLSLDVAEEIAPRIGVEGSYPLLG